MAFIAANPKFRTLQGIGTSKEQTTTAGVQMKILLKNGNIMIIPTADILRIEFGN